MTYYIQNNKWQLTGMGCVVLLMYFFFGYFMPEFNKTLQIYQSWQEKEETIASVSNWENQLDQLNNQQKKLENFFSQIYVSLPDNDQMSAIVNQVFNEAGAVQLKISSMRPAERVDLESHIEIPLTITIRGGYHEIGRFVNAIEQSDYLMKVDGIRIQAEQDADSVLVGEILIKVIILKNNSEKT